MDALSRLLRMARLDAALDKHCLLAPATVMDIDRQGEREAAFHVLLEGECRFEVGDVVLELTAGDVVIVPSGSSHRVTTPGEGRPTGTIETRGPVFVTTRSVGGGHPAIDLYCGHYTYGPGAGAVLFDSLPTPLRVSLGSPEQQPLLSALSALLRTEALDEGRGTAAVMSSLCTVLLAYVLRTARAAAEAPVWTGAADPDIARVIDAVLDAPGDEWPMQRLAAVGRMSRATFLRRFRREAGTTPGHFLARVRIIAGADLLTSADLSVSEVAAMVGYRSESSFSRAFRGEIGQSPGRFRRSAAASPSPASDEAGGPAGAI
ncbi:AraC family transcriptional regulator [Pseudolysinimonas kribbensis]|uniref:AraC family transcriptional regulator n=1 Tax=Pseudolysinimonas kribbensis TaxID=433641 RepID=UPI0031E1F00A